MCWLPRSTSNHSSTPSWIGRAGHQAPPLKSCQTKNMFRQLILSFVLSSKKTVAKGVRRSKCSEYRGLLPILQASYNTARQLADNCRSIELVAKEIIILSSFQKLTPSRANLCFILSPFWPLQCEVQRCAYRRWTRQPKLSQECGRVPFPEGDHRSLWYFFLIVINHFVIFTNKLSLSPSLSLSFFLDQERPGQTRTDQESPGQVRTDKPNQTRPNQTKTDQTADGTISMTEEKKDLTCYIYILWLFICFCCSK